MRLVNRVGLAVYGPALSRGGCKGLGTVLPAPPAYCFLEKGASCAALLPGLALLHRSHPICWVAGAVHGDVRSRSFIRLISKLHLRV